MSRKSKSSRNQHTASQGNRKIQAAKSILLVVGSVVVVGMSVAMLSDSMQHISTASVMRSSQDAVPQTLHQETDCNVGPANPVTAAVFSLEEDAADWGVFCENGPLWRKENVVAPALDNNALACAITGGEPYSNVHCYRNLPPLPTADEFSLTLSFWYSPTTTFNNQDAPSIVQALEFTMNRWHESQRHEWAVQWQNVGIDAPQWRYWDPHHGEKWIALPVKDAQSLEVKSNEWHSLVLEGEIIEGQDRYTQFCIDQQCYPLDITVSPADAANEQGLAAIAFQLDGNYAQDNYIVYVDQVNFEHWPPYQVYFPLAAR